MTLMSACLIAWLFRHVRHGPRAHFPQSGCSRLKSFRMTSLLIRRAVPSLQGIRREAARVLSDDRVRDMSSISLCESGASQHKSPQYTDLHQ
jgi:hypothetical protein